MSSYHDELQALAAAIGSDGCTGVPEFYQDCCLEHDIAYALGTTPRGVPTTKAQADRRFRDCNQAHSPLRFLSPLAWWRWTAVHLFGHPLPRLAATTRPVLKQAIVRALLRERLAEAAAARERMRGEAESR